MRSLTPVIPAEATRAARTQPALLAAPSVLGVQALLLTPRRTTAILAVGEVEFGPAAGHNPWPDTFAKLYIGEMRRKPGRFTPGGARRCVRLVGGPTCVAAVPPHRRTQALLGRARSGRAM